MNTYTYREWTIERIETVHLGYKEACKGARKYKGYLLKGPDGTEKIKDTLQEAKSYIDMYMGV